MSVTRIPPVPGQQGLVTAIGDALPAARDEAATAIDRVSALEELLELAAVCAHGRDVVDVRVDELLADQPDEHQRSRVRAVAKRAGVNYRSEERRVDIQRATAATSRPAAEGLDAGERR